MFTQNQIDDIVTLLQASGPDTKIYMGCDSVRFRRPDGNTYARYATVCIVHMEGRKGCRLFKNVSIERDFDVKQNRPKIRMMNEVMKVCELYNQLIPFIEELAEVYQDKNGEIQVKEFDVEIHLDISTDPKNGSNCAAKEAAGYVLAMTGKEPRLKPDSFAASFGADAVANSRA